MDIAIHIDGMTCGACVSRIDKALRSVPGVQDAAINLTTGMASIQGEPDTAKILLAVNRAGYHAQLLADTSAATLRQLDVRGEEQSQKLRDRFILGCLFGVPAAFIEMLLHRQRYVHEHWQSAIDTRYNALLVIFATCAIIGAGWPFLRNGFRAAIRLSPNMDTLVALGAGTAYLASFISVVIWSAQPGEPNTHTVGFPQPAISEFHAAIAIVVLVTLGKYLEARAIKRAASAIAGLANNSAPTASRRLPDGSFETLPAEHIQIGDHLQILAHQRLPVDGTLIDGAGTLNLSVITGESLPVELSATGASDHSRILPGGATLADGRILLCATSTAATSTVARILTLVNASQASKTHIQSLADRIAAIFVPIILALAILNFIAWMLLTHDLHSALLTSIATIVIACPCAMGLATPAAITVALGRAARMGVLFTNAAALESASSINTVLFDKTGTLTTGTLQVTAIDPTPGIALPAPDVLALAASVEQFSEHPLAKAIVAHAAAQHAVLREPTRFHSIPGGGVRATFHDHHEYAVGSARLMTDLHLTPPTAGALSHRIHLADLTDHKLLATITFADTLRPDAAATVAALRARGLHVGVISGDTAESARDALKSIPLDSLRAGVKPEEKAAAISHFKSQISNLTSTSPGVAFIGDGINDAPALAAADLGVAMATGTDLAKTAGDVLLLSNRLSTIPALLQLSRRTLRIIRQNLFWAFFYNIAAIPLAMLGILSPGVAAGAMVLSSLTVVANALRIYHVRLSTNSP